MWGITDPDGTNLAAAIEKLSSSTVLSGQESYTATDRIGVCVREHGAVHDNQPVETADGALIWLWGDIYSIKDSTARDGYRSLDREEYPSDVQRCVALYETYGTDFAQLLNGEFVAIVYDGTSGYVHLITDRISTRPIFYTTTSTGRFVFASRIQSLANCEDVQLSFDPDYLCEYFSLMKAFGVKTPLVGVEQIPPASIMTVDTETLDIEVETYWTPEYSPLDKPFSYFVEEFTRRFCNVVRERTSGEQSYGLLLSGGSDSRLVLAALREFDRDVTCYHLSNWMSREARTAERVAMTAGAEFEWLRRGRNYHDTLLAETPELSNFIACFDESFAHGFAQQLAADVDSLITGYLGDTMYGGYTLYPRKLPLGPIHLPLPVERTIRTPEEYITQYANREAYAGRSPAFFDHEKTLLEILRENIVADTDGISHHGVRYPSVRELQLCEYYPLTNQFASFNHNGLQQIAHHWSPFFDNRLIDLHLRMPVRYQLRRDIVAAAVTRLDRELADISHAGTGVPLSSSFPITYSIGYVNEFRWRYLTSSRAPYPQAGDGAWMDESEVIRETDIVDRVLQKRQPLVESLPFLDGDTIDKIYRDHLTGADHWLTLYTLITFLEMPITSQITEQIESD